MRRLFATAGTALALAVSAPAAQAQQACSNPLAADACAIGADLFQYMAPQLATAIAGGSHTLGVGTNLGGFPHFAIALRANAVAGSLPTIDNVNAGAASQKSFVTEDQPVPMVTADFALGLTKGFNVGVTRIGGIDFIGSATYVPEVSDGDFTIAAQDSPLSIGYGARIGLLQQSAIIPGVAISYMKRDLPTFDFGATSEDGAVFAIDDFSVKTSGWRLSAQKNLLLFQLGAGYGQDTYDYSTAASVTVSGQNGSFSVSESVKRNTMYGTLGVNLFLVKVVAEIGQVSGGTINTFNTFDTEADASRLYGTLGVRISF
jgi:hypothetical protein